MHLLNIVIHVACGIAAMAIGFLILATEKGTARHRRLGRRFAWLTLAVCLSAVVGNLAFRFIALFAILTVLVLYQFLGAWRAVVTRERGPALIDAALTACAAAGAFMLAPVVLLAPATGSGAPAVIGSTFAALTVVIGYDICRWLFPPHWHASLWRYEHVYKSIASLFAMLSAASGNLIRFGHPWSQLLPSVLGMGTICWMLWLTWRRRHAA
jgi:uncharacterized membrane protein